MEGIWIERSLKTLEEACGNRTALIVYDMQVGNFQPIKQWI